VTLATARAHVQCGVALIALVALLAGAFASVVVQTFGRSLGSRAEKAAASALALAEGKRALLAYVAHYAARSSHQVPGRMPCPEPLAPAEGKEGFAAALGCNSNTQTYVGRLPWRTLGIAQLRDGAGEPLWYVLGPGFRTPPINFDSVGGLTLDAATHAAVALLIAPGVPLDTLLDPGSPPPGCSRTRQSALRYPTPFVAFDPAQFLECGNTGASYETRPASQWFNDQVLAVTAADLMTAIAGPIADRLQRVAAPAIAAWDEAELAATGKSWGVTHAAPYLPFASAFGDPAVNGYCGAAGVHEGLPPLAPRTSGTCGTAWSANVTSVAGVDSLGCEALAAALRCSFRAAGGPSAPSAHIEAAAPHVAGSFRGTITADDIAVSHGGSATLVMQLSAASGGASAAVDVSWPPALAAGQTLTVALPDLPEAELLEDPRLAWFFDNEWWRHVYYAVAASAVAGASQPCAAPDDTGCLAVYGLPSSTGAFWDKRLVLTLMGQALPGQSRSCATDVNGDTIADCDDRTQYLEAENAGSADRVFRADWRVPNPAAMPPPWPALNDRVAACPLHYTRENGTIVAVCD
jgi:hypothetical protein